MLGINKKLVKNQIMNFDELMSELKKANIPFSRCLQNKGNTLDDEYVLVHKNDMWVVIYYERGYGHPQSFNTEQSACEHILRCLNSQKNKL